MRPPAADLVHRSSRNNSRCWNIPDVEGCRSQTGFNDIEVADDGATYATQTGVDGPNPDATTWQVEDHPRRGGIDLRARRRGESAGDSDEREQRARVHPAELRVIYGAEVGQIDVKKYVKE
jgi:hypothetical protein